MAPLTPLTRIQRQPKTVFRLPFSGLILALCSLGALPTSAQPATQANARGAIIPISGTINDVVRDSIQRRIDAARNDGANVLIFEMDTPGGLVSSALDICRIIKSQPDHIRTVAWVNPDAYSAGAMISVACNEIWMSPSSSVGDCAPIMVVPGGGVQELGEAERAKAESPILQEFRDSAVRNGYDLLLSRAMVAVGTEVWWIEKIDGDERRFINSDEKKTLIDDVPDEEREWRLVGTATRPDTGEAIPVRQPVDRADELLTMSQFDAVLYGFARGIFDGPSDMPSQLSLSAPPERYELSGWEVFAIWLNSPLIRGILLVLVLIGGYIEFQSPGLILPGATALLALAIFLAAPYAAGLATFWPILLFALGVILLLVEAFVFPGFGVAGILGMLLVAVAAIGSFVPFERELPTFSAPSLRQIWEGIQTGILVVVSSLLIAVAGMVALAHYLPKSKLARGVLLTSIPGGGSSGTLPDAHPTVALVGDVGTVTGALRPGGQARFGGEIVDVCSQGEYVDAGRRVQVIRREGMRIVVRPLADGETPTG